MYCFIADCHIHWHFGSSFIWYTSLVQYRFIILYKQVVMGLRNLRILRKSHVLNVYFFLKCQESCSYFWLIYFLGNKLIFLWWKGVDLFEYSAVSFTMHFPIFICKKAWIYFIFLSNLKSTLLCRVKQPLLVKLKEVFIQSKCRKVLEWNKNYSFL